MAEEYVKSRNDTMLLTFRRADKWKEFRYWTVSKQYKISTISGKLHRQAIGQIVKFKK